MEDPIRGSRRPALLTFFLTWASLLPLAMPARLSAATGGNEAPDLPSPLSLEQALSLAGTRGFDALLAETALRGARADVVAARRGANPLASGTIVRSTGVPSAGGETAASGFSVSLADQGLLEGLVSGKRRLRIAQAEAGAAAAASGREDAIRLLRLAVATAYRQAIEAQAVEKLDRDVAQSYARTLDLVRTRYRFGSVSEVDVDRVETAKLESEQVAADAAAQREQALATLAFLLGSRRGAAGLEISGNLAATPPAWLDGATPAGITAEALARRPDVALARASLDRAREILALARRERLPDIALSAAYSREGPDAAPITPPTVSVGAALELPVFNQRQGEIARAASDVESARVLFDRVSAAAATDVVAAWAAYTAAREKLGRMRNRLREVARRARDLAEIQYRAGSISLIDLLDAERTDLSVEVEFFQDELNLCVAVAQLETAAAREITP